MAISAQGEDRSDFQDPFPVPYTRDFGFTKATEGLTWKSHTFATNWERLREQGKVRGAYHFLHPHENGAAQADFFLAFIEANGGFKDGDILVVDSELMSGEAEWSLRSEVHWGLAAGLPRFVTGSEVDASTKAFLDRCQALLEGKVKVILMTYTMHAVGQYLHRTAAAYPELWFAYPSHSAPPASYIAPWTKWRIWQWGIVSNVDRDAYNGSASDMNAWVKSYTSPPKVTKVVLTDGRRSLRAYCDPHGDSPLRVLARTFKHGFHPRLIAYAMAHPAFRARMPKGIRIYLRVAAH